MKFTKPFLIFLSLLLFGCAAGRMSQGDQFLAAKNYNDAVKAYLSQLKEIPDNAAIWRQLGISYLKLNRVDKGLKSLQKANSLQPNDPKTHFYLGAAYQAAGDFEKALTWLKRSAFEKSAKKIDPTLAAKLDQVTREYYQQQAAYAVKNEKYIAMQQPEENSIAVLYFKNVGHSKELSPLQKGLAEMVITDLSQISRLKVVERVKLQKLLEEIGLAQSGLVDASTSPRVGKLLGASQLVQGSFLDINEKTIKMDAGLLETTSGRSTSAKEVSGDIEGIFRLEKNLVFNVLRGMGIRPSETERKAIMEIPTENLLAFLAYSKGLDFQDRGMYAAAGNSFAEAAKLDPGFSKAIQQQKIVQKIESGSDDLGSYEPTGSTSQSAPAVSTRSRLENSMAKIDAGFIPTTDPGEPAASSSLRKPVEEQSNTQGFGGIPILIEIQLPE